MIRYNLIIFLCTKKDLLLSLYKQNGASEGTSHHIWIFLINTLIKSIL